MENLNIFKNPIDHKSIEIKSVFLIYRLRWMVHNQHANYVFKHTHDEGYYLIFGHDENNHLINDAKEEFKSLSEKLYGYSLKEIM